MSDAIKVGDLVMVVKPGECCDKLSNIGKVFRVLEVRPTRAICSKCYRLIDQELRAFSNTRTAYRLDRLKKIDPPAEPQHVHTIEELTA